MFSKGHRSDRKQQVSFLLQFLCLGVLFLAAPFCLAAQEAEKAFFEKGTVKAPSHDGDTHAYPVIARTSSGKLITVWGQSGGGIRFSRIMGSVSEDNGKTWGKIFKIIDNDGLSDSDPSILIDGKRILVYSSSVVPPNNITKIFTWVAISEDDGETWTKPVEVKSEYNYLVGKRHLGLKLKDGTLMMPGGFDRWAQLGGVPARTEGEMDLISGVMLSKDGVNWTPYFSLHVVAQKVTPFGTNGLGEPAVVELENGELYTLLRSGTERMYEARSKDGGKTWSDPVPSALYGHNIPASLWRLDQKPEEIIVIWNNSPRERHPLSVSISADGGRTWSEPKNVADITGTQKFYHDLQISYPGITQGTDGNFVAVWMEQLPDKKGRAIRWARFNRAWVLSK